MSAITRKDGSRRNSLTVQLELPAEAVESFARAIGDLPEGIQGKFVRKAVNRLGTVMRAAMRDGAKTYTRSGALARSMVKKSIYYPTGVVLILAGPSRRFRSLYRNQRVVPWRYAHLPEFGTQSRYHKKGRKVIYVPWLGRRIRVPEIQGVTRYVRQHTGKVAGPRRITMALRARIPQAVENMAADVANEFKRWWARQAPNITKAKYRPDSVRMVGSEAVDI